MSLVDKLGPEYIGEFFRNAVFMRNNKLCMIRNCSSTNVELMTADINDPGSTWTREYMPKDELESFKTIAWPKLGYRNVLAGNRGNLAVYITAARSVQRGLRTDLLDWKHVEVAGMLNLNMNNYMPSADSMYQLRQVFSPTFHKFSDGIKHIRTGKWCSFAINEDTAVAVSSSSAEGFCDILFRDKQVGNISEKGDITLSNQAMKQGSIRRVFS